MFSRKAKGRLQFPLIASSILAMLAALWAGLVRLGWGWPAMQPTLPLAHGPLMISGFLGTLIAVERVVALGQPWMYSSPTFTGLGGLLLILGIPGIIPPLLITLGSLGLGIIMAIIVHRQPAAYTTMMAISALAWLVGNIFWLLGSPIYRLVFWWAGFLILTIAGERLELNRIVQLSRGSKIAFLGAASLLVIGLMFMPWLLNFGMRLVSLGMSAIAIWLLRYDLARRTVYKSGLPRYTAICLLAGYFWLAIAGCLGIAFGGLVAGLRYDAVLHAIFLGFVLSMIFGHAPIIFPAVLNLQIDFHRTLYVPLIFLHLSLALRAIGDLVGFQEVRLWGGLFNGIALLLFLTNIIFNGVILSPGGTALSNQT